MKRSEELWTDEEQFMDSVPGGFAELSPGDAIGKFRIIRELGKGGMGAVYLAVNPTLQIEVALKILPPSVVRGTPQVADRFIREARLAARISHPNVVAVKDADIDRATGLYYIVLEYVSGGSLGDRLASSGPLSEDEALRVVYDVAQALVAAEEHGIVHRDIKPDNIMLDSRGIAKLADLGVAKQAMAKATNLTQEGSSIGTPAYMSPDQIRNAQDVDTRDDIYSLGATLYELLTGQPPFDGSTAYNIVSKVLSSPTPNVRDLNPDVSPSVAGLCLKMMARSKNARHQNATALINDLERLSELGWGPDSDPHQKETLAGDNTMLIPPSLEQMARRHANRYAESVHDEEGEAGTSRTITWVLAGLLGLALVGGAFVWLRGKSEAVIDPGKLPLVVEHPKATNSNKLSATDRSPVTPTPGEVKEPGSGTATTPQPSNNGKSGKTTTKPAKDKDKDKEPVPPKAIPVHPEDYPNNFRPKDPAQTGGLNPSDPTLPAIAGTERIPQPPSETLPIIPKLEVPDPIKDFPTIPSPTNSVAEVPQPPAVPDPANPVVPTPVPVVPPVEIVVPEIAEVLAGSLPVIVPPGPIVTASNTGGTSTDAEVITISTLKQPRPMSAFDARGVAAARLKDSSVSNKLLQIKGIQPTGTTVTPTEWRFYFYDPSGNQRYRRVDVVNGSASAPEDGIYMGVPWDPRAILSNDLLNTDSDRALSTIKAQSRMVGVTLTSTSFNLDNKDTAPVWRVKLFGYTSKKPKIRSLGEATVFVESGKLHRLDVKLD